MMGSVCRRRFCHWRGDAASTPSCSCEPRYSALPAPPASALAWRPRSSSSDEFPPPVPAAAAATAAATSAARESSMSAEATLPRMSRAAGPPCARGMSDPVGTLQARWGITAGLKPDPSGVPDRGPDTGLPDDAGSLSGACRSNQRWLILRLQSKRPVWMQQTRVGTHASGDEADMVRQTCERCFSSHDQWHTPHPRQSMDVGRHTDCEILTTSRLSNRSLCCDAGL